MTQTSDALRGLLRELAERLTITRPLAVFDLESTGPNPERDRIVEVTIGRVDPMPPFNTQLLHSYVNPGIPIPAEATAVHGITDDQVKDAPAFISVAKFVVRMLAGADLVGYNHRRFDVRMVVNELQRAGIENPCDGARLVDAQLIYFKREPRDLSAAMRFFCGEEHADAHGTTGDVIATLRVLLAQFDRYEDLPRDVEQLDALGRDPSFIDRDGKIVWRGGDACIGFGKHQGVPLRICDPGFLYWILDKDFAPDTKEIVSRALRGIYPTPPPASESQAVA